MVEVTFHLSNYTLQLNSSVYSIIFTMLFSNLFNGSACSFSFEVEVYETV